MAEVISNTTEYSFACRVYIEDTDVIGIVYHANYLLFFERARTEALRDKGFSLTIMATDDTYFAVHDAHLRFLYPARLDDVLSIKTTFSKKKSCSVMFRQVMYNQLGQLLSEATIQVVCVNRHLKPKRLPDKLI